jgi:hypothetical protein
MQHQPREVDIRRALHSRFPLVHGVRQSAHSPEAMKFKASGIAILTVSWYVTHDDESPP